jgi:hypothetical protein
MVLGKQTGEFLSRIIRPSPKLEGVAGAHEWPFGEFGGIILKSREVAKAAKGTFLGPTSRLRGTFLAVFFDETPEAGTPNENRTPACAELYNLLTEG